VSFEVGRKDFTCTVGMYVDDSDAESVNDDGINHTTPSHSFPHRSTESIPKRIQGRTSSDSGRVSWEQGPLVLLRFSARLTSD
jgi:hypothetical protein